LGSLFSIDELGNWQIGKRMSYVPNSHGLWAIEIALPQKIKLEYKYLLAKNLSDIQWENGPNRSLSIEQNVAGTIEVRDMWQGIQHLTSPLPMVINGVERVCASFFSYNSGI
jgi:hypothetical protein